MESISCHITPLVINSLGGMHARTRACAHTHTLMICTGSILRNQAHPDLRPACAWFKNLKWYNLLKCNRQWNCINISIFNVTNPLKVSVCDKEVQTWTIAPTEYDSNWVLLGETSKIIKMSEQRVTKLMVTSGYLIVQLHGSPQEIVTMAATDENNGIQQKISYTIIVLYQMMKKLFCIYPMGVLILTWQQRLIMSIFISRYCNFVLYYKL